MKTRAFLLLSVLSLVLLGVGFYFINRISTELSGASRASDVPSDFRTRLKSSRPFGAGKSSQPLAPAKVVYVTNAFNWRQVESADYREYIANLRAINCPEATIKDIILTDVMRLYAARRGEFYHNGREFKFWETDEKRKLKARELKAREKQLAQIDKEIPAILRELLGINYEREINKYFVDTNEDERRLGFLVETKRGRVLAVRDQIEGMREKILERAGDGELSIADRQKLKELEDFRLAELGKFLGTSELEELELRTSSTADRLRAELVGFDPSEEEFRKIYGLLRSHDDRFGFVDATNDLVVRAKDKEEQEIEAELHQMMGDARFAEYQRARNPDYRNLCLFTELYELPASTAQTIFDIKQIAERERLNLFSRQDITADGRSEALKAIQAETEKSLLQLLGTKILSTYTQTSGRWVNELSVAN
jgi:hypothetical protein